MSANVKRLELLRGGPVAQRKPMLVQPHLHFHEALHLEGPANQGENKLVLQINAI
jgi:hypothetical protein